MTRYEDLGFLVNHLNLSLQNELDVQLKKYNLDIKSWPVLFALWQEEGISQTELSRRCNLAGYTMTRLLDHLQELGFITRHQELDNRRTFKILLTKNAKAMKLDVLYEAERVNEKFLANLSLEHRQQFIELLQKINQFDQYY